MRNTSLTFNSVKYVSVKILSCLFFFFLNVKWEGRLLNFIFLWKSKTESVFPSHFSIWFQEITLEFSLFSFMTDI